MFLGFFINYDCCYVALYGTICPCIVEYCFHLTDCKHDSIIDGNVISYVLSIMNVILPYMEQFALTVLYSIVSMVSDCGRAPIQWKVQ